MENATPERATIEALVAKFADNIRELKAPATKEATLRVQYLDPFFKLLGWDVSNDAGLPVDDQEVIIEPSIDVAERDKLRARRPDYLFRIERHPQLTCEAKKPAVHIDRDRDAIFQAKRDAYSLGLPFTILTDFEYFRVYDTGYQPDHDSPNHGLVPEFSLGFADYPAQWDVLRATFGRDAVANGSLDKLRARTRGTRAGQRIRGIDRELFELRGDKPAGDAFLAQLENQRRHVATDIYANNRPKFADVNSPRGSARLAEYTQRLIDRIVFMRICEDRNAVNYGILRDLVHESQAQGRPIRDLLIRQFRQYDKDFNGYLFKPHDIETCNFTPAVLRDLIAQFYPPECRTNFAVLPDDLLATVYERFLGSAIAVQRGHVDIMEKPEVRHAGGVYYTPKFVVDSICRRVIAPKLSGKTPLDLLDHNLTILDPACGSGSFLIAAYDLLVRHCERAITADPRLAKAPIPGSRKKQPIAFQQNFILATTAAGQAAKAEKVWRLTPDFKGRLLTDCIFGVDIDQQAVEVTIMSLYSKVLSDLPSDWRGISEQRILPPLDNNIRCGNSLIDQDRLDAYAEELHGDLFAGDDNVRFRINAFDWHSETRGLGRILGGRAEKDRGFDCVIGNPPYIRVQELNQWAPDECQFYKWQYQSAARGNYDIYVVFTERVLTGGKQGRGLIKPDGAMGFIMPHKWWQAAYGAGLRQIVADGKYLRSVVDFGDQQVFKGATTYTAIQHLGCRGRASVQYAKVLALIDGASQLARLDADRADDNSIRFHTEHPSTNDEWRFIDYDTRQWLARVQRASRPLGDVALNIFVGIQTSADRVFLLERNDKGWFSKALEQNVQLDTELMHPMLKGSVHMRRWRPDPTSRYVLFPYERLGDQFALIGPDRLEARFSASWKYLQSCRRVLAARERGRDQGEHWYGYVYPKNFVYMNERKLLIPSMVQRPEFGFDEDGSKFFVGSGAGGGGGYGIILPKDVSYFLVLGILNSALIERIARATGTPFQNGWYSYDKGVLENLPIKLPSSGAERKLAERIEDSVKKILTDKNALASGRVNGERDRRDLNTGIEAAERRIDDDVMKLYEFDRLPG